MSGRIWFIPGWITDSFLNVGNAPEKEERIVIDESASSYNKVRLSSTHQSNRNWNQILSIIEDSVGGKRR